MVGEVMCWFCVDFSLNFAGWTGFLVNGLDSCLDFGQF